MSHLLLIGFMGAGKSTVGRIVADRLGRGFIDLDSLIEEREGRSVREIFASDGETTFRALETSAVRSLLDVPPSVIAAGGGVVISDSNRALLGSLGTVVYLKVTAAETLARVGDDSTRPLLSGGGGALAASTLLDAREALYSAVADVVIDTVGRTPEQVADDVVNATQERSAQ